MIKLQKGQTYCLRKGKYFKIGKLLFQVEIVLDETEDSIIGIIIGIQC